MSEDGREGLEPDQRQRALPGRSAAAHWGQATSVLGAHVGLVDRLGPCPAVLLGKGGRHCLQEGLWHLLGMGSQEATYFFSLHRRLLGSRQLLAADQAVGIAWTALQPRRSRIVAAGEETGQVGFACWEEQEGPS